MIAGASWPGGPIGPAGPISPRWPSRPGTPRAPSAQTLRNDGGKAFVAPIGRYLRLLLNRGVAQLADEASPAIVPVFHDEIAVQTAREVPIFPLEPAWLVFVAPGKLRLAFVGAALLLRVAFPQQRDLKMSDWRIRHKDADGRDAQATLLSREAAIVLIW